MTTCSVYKTLFSRLVYFRGGPLEDCQIVSLQSTKRASICFLLTLIFHDLREEEEEKILESFSISGPKRVLAIFLLWFNFFSRASFLIKAFCPQVSFLLERWEGASSVSPFSLFFPSQAASLSSFDTRLVQRGFGGYENEIRWTEFICWRHFCCFFVFRCFFGGCCLPLVLVFLPLHDHCMTETISRWAKEKR